MVKADKTLEKMRNNPRDWKINELGMIARRFGIEIRQGKGSHVSFSHPKSADIITIPAHRPIKPVYVKRLVSLIDMIIGDET